MGKHSSYRVPTGRPFLMREMHNKLPGIDDRIAMLPDPADPTEYEDIADALWDLFLVVKNLAPSPNATGCQRHPGGPVDTEAPAGWGRCLLCNHNRRISHPEAKKAMESATSHWAVPDPPYDHTALMAARRALNETVVELDYRSSDQEFQKTADLVHAAFIITRELSRPRVSGCQRHPGAPLDPAAPGGPRCVLCVTREHRERVGPPTVRIRPSRPVPPTIRRLGTRAWDRP
ncbi:hypothetical protein [Streptomyces olivaceoviridis]|uniref:hypothetical protein n=1 Tax=Streptomyces olivaceoviridis TaxID=1921 RepID=UPI00378A9E0B